MHQLTLGILATAGSALVLTQSSLTAPVRGAIDKAASWASDYANRDILVVWPFDKILVALLRLLAKLLSCPMCAGFWLGLAWSGALGSRGLVLAALGFAGSLSSALLVALWLALSEVYSTLSLWRYLNTPENTGQRD